MVNNSRDNNFLEGFIIIKARDGIGYWRKPELLPQMW